MFDSFAYNTRVFLEALQKRGVHTEIIEGTMVVRASKGKKSTFLIDYALESEDYATAWVASNKWFAKQILKKHGIAVPDGTLFDVRTITDEKLIRLASKLSYPVVVKPVMMSQGFQVHSFIENDADLLWAIAQARKQDKETHFIVEKHFPGIEHRIFVTSSGFTAVAKRLPAKVKGDGVSSITVLAERENYRRLHPRTTCLSTLKLDDIALAYLQKQGKDFHTIPKKGEWVQLRSNSNVTTGGNCHEVTGKAHHSFAEFGRKVSVLFPGLNMMGIDILCQDVTKPLSRQPYAVCELNVLPGLTLHSVPETGRKRNAPDAAAAILFDKGLL